MAAQRSRQIDGKPVSSPLHKPWVFFATCLAVNVIVSITIVLAMYYHLRGANDQGPRNVAAEPEAVSDEVLPAPSKEPNDLPAPPLLAAEIVSQNSNDVPSEALMPPVPVTVAEEMKPPVIGDVPANEEAWTPDASTPPPALTPVSERTVASASGTFTLPAEQIDSQEVAVEQQEPEVLLYGPLHEAFGEPIGYEDAAEPELVAEEPPVPVEEYPPDEQPVAQMGQSVVWIPGYWQWDGDRHSHIWQTGMWRIAPVGCRWVPGYWHHAAPRWQWVSGFWVTSDRPIQYILPPPPVANLDPDRDRLPHNWDSIWVPGYCSFEGGQYVWQRGYWMTPQPNRLWVPPHYHHTPRGYVFIAGYWDYPMEQRGVIFAPVYFRIGVHRQFRPSIVIAATRLPECLFSSPVDHRYYFGDYFDAQRRASLRLHPWFERQEHPTSGWYDPLYAHYRSVHLREDRSWELRLRTAYEYRTNHEEARPLHVYKPDLAGPTVARDVKRPIPLAAPLTSMTVEVKGNPAPLKFQPVTVERRDQILADRKKLHDYAENRRETEEGAARARQNLAESTRRPADVQERMRPEPVAAEQARQRQAVVEQTSGQRKTADRTRPDVIERQKLETAKRDAEAKVKLDDTSEAGKQAETADRARQQQAAAKEAGQKPAAEQARQQQEAASRAKQQQTAADRVKQQQEAERLKSQQEAAAKAKQDAGAKAKLEEAQRTKREADDRVAQEVARKLKAQQDATEQAKQKEATERAKQQQAAAEQAKQKEAADRARQQQEAAAEKAKQQQIAAEPAKQREAAEQTRRQQEAAQRAKEQQAAEQAKQKEAAERARQQQVAAEQAKQKEAADRTRQQQEAAEKAKQQQIAAEQAKQKEAERARQQQEAAERAKQQQAAAEEARQKHAAEQARQQQEAAQRAKEQQAAAERARQQQEAEQKAKQREAEERARQQREAEDRARQQREAEQRAKQQEQQNKNQGAQQKGRGQ
jgi:hypothetical protein